MAGIKIKVGADASQFEKAMNGVKSRLTGLNVMVGGMMAFKALSASIAAVGNAAGTAARGMMSLIKAGEEAKTEEARLRNVVKQMGIYGNAADTVTDRLLSQADALELLTGVDGEVITMTQSMLATFRDLAGTANVTGGAFDRATQAAIDLAATGFGEARSNAIMLGKALQDPERGLTSLRRTGALTTAQIDKIKTSFETTGDRAKYMDDVLSAIETQVKGTAAATADSTVRMGKAFDQLREEIGKPISDQFDKLAKMLMDKMPAFKDAAASIGRAIANTLASAIQGDYAKLQAMGQAIGEIIVAGFKMATAGLGHDLNATISEGLSGGVIADLTGIDTFKTQGQLSRSKAALARLEAKTSVPRDLQTNISALMRQLEYDPNFRMTAPSGRSFRQAAPNEPTPLRDETGRRLIEIMEKVERNTSPVPFPAR